MTENRSVSTIENISYIFLYIYIHISMMQDSVHQVVLVIGFYELLLVIGLLLQYFVSERHSTKKN